MVRGSFSVGAPPSDKAGDVGEHVGKEDVIAAEDIALADPAAVERGDVARRDVIDMGEVQPGVHEGGHAPRRGLDDDPASRRRPHVARTDRRRRIDDDGRQPVPTDHGLDQTFRRDLAALVGADRRVFGQGWSSVATAPSTSFKVATLLV